MRMCNYHDYYKKIIPLRIDTRKYRLRHSFFSSILTKITKTMAKMVCGRNVLWPNRSVDKTSRKHINRGSRVSVLLK